MVAKASRSRRPTGIPRYHETSQLQTKVSSEPQPGGKQGKSPGNGHEGSKGFVESEQSSNDRDSKLPATKQASQAADRKKAFVHSKRQKFESLIADMISKQTVRSAAASARRVESLPPKSQEVVQPVKKQDQEKHPSKVTIYRNRSNEKLKQFSPESPFRKLIDIEMNSDEQVVLSPYTNLQFSMLGLARGKMELDSPIAKRRKAHPTYDTLQNLRQKAQRNLDLLDSSTSRKQEARDTTPTNHASDTNTAAFPLKTVTHSTMRAATKALTKKYILGNSSTLIEESKKKKEKHEILATNQKSQAVSDRDAGPLETLQTVSVSSGSSNSGTSVVSSQDKEDADGFKEMKKRGLNGSYDHGLAPPSQSSGSKPPRPSINKASKIHANNSSTDQILASRSFDQVIKRPYTDAMGAESHHYEKACSEAQVVSIKSDPMSTAPLTGSSSDDGIIERSSILSSPVDLKKIKKGKLKRNKEESKKKLIESASQEGVLEQGSEVGPEVAFEGAPKIPGNKRMPTSFSSSSDKKSSDNVQQNGRADNNKPQTRSKGVDVGKSEPKGQKHKTKKNQKGRSRSRKHLDKNDNTTGRPSSYAEYYRAKVLQRMQQEEQQKAFQKNEQQQGCASELPSSLITVKDGLGIPSTKTNWGLAEPSIRNDESFAAYTDGERHSKATTIHVKYIQTNTEPAIISLVESDLDEAYSPNRQASRARGYGNRYRIEKTRYLDDQEDSQRKTSTFVQEIKKGKDIKESLRHLRHVAKKKKKGRSRRQSEEEIVFVDDNPNEIETSHYKEREIIMIEDSEGRSYPDEEIVFVKETTKGAEKESAAKRITKTKRDPPREAENEKQAARRGGRGKRSSNIKSDFNISCDPVASPLTMEGLVIEESSSDDCSYPSARSDCIEIHSEYSNFVGRDIKCCGDSVLTDDFAGLSLTQTRTENTDINSTMEISEEDSFFSRGVTEKESEEKVDRLTPLTRRRRNIGDLKTPPGQKIRVNGTQWPDPDIPGGNRNQILSAKKRTLSPRLEGANSQDQRQEKASGDFHKQVSTLLKTVGKVVPPVTNTHLEMVENKPDIHEIPGEVKAVAESMGLQVIGSSINDQGVMELKLRAVAHQDKDARDLDESKGANDDGNSQMSDDLEFAALKQQLSDLSTHVSEAILGTENSNSWIPDCLARSKPLVPEAPKVKNIISSSPIISRFLNRKQRGQKLLVENAEPDGSVREDRLPWPLGLKKTLRHERKDQEWKSSHGAGIGGSDNPLLGVHLSSLKDKKNSTDPREQDRGEETTLSNGLRKKSEVFGRFVSPLTIPSMTIANGKDMFGSLLPRPATDAASHGKGVRSETPERKPYFLDLLQKPLQTQAADEARKPDPEDARQRRYCMPWSGRSGLSSISAKHQEVLSDGISSLGASTQTDSHCSTFMTSFVVKKRTLSKMSSVSESGESSQLSRSNAESKSSESSVPSESSTPMPPSIMTPSRQDDPPSLRTSESGPKVTSQSNSLMSYSIESNSKSTSISCDDGPATPARPKLPPRLPSPSTSPSSYDRQQTTAQRTTYEGNPLKNLLSRPLSRPRDHRRLNLSESSTSTGVRERIYKMHAAAGDSRRLQTTNDFHYHGRDDYDDNDSRRRHSDGNESDFYEDELTLLQSWIGTCGADPPGVQVKGTSLGPPVQPSGTVDNIDNLVLASWGLHNRMDQLRSALAFSPGAASSLKVHPRALPYKGSKGSSRSGAVLINECQRSDGGDNELSSVSESSTCTSYILYKDENSRMSKSDEVDDEIPKNNTLETDNALFRGGKHTKRSTTPQTLKAFRSKSWKLDGGENSIVASDTNTHPPSSADGAFASPLVRNPHRMV